jgi:hypothetical protein
MDPGLGDLAYDGTEYEYDEFGERVGSEDMFEDDSMDDSMSEDEAIPMPSGDMPEEKHLEDGFGETINPDANPHLEDQLADDSLSQEAAADYNESDMDMPSSDSAEDKPAT